MRGQTHRACDAMMTRAIAYIKHGGICLPEPPQLLVALLPEPQPPQPQMPEPQMPEPQVLVPKCVPEPYVPGPCCGCASQLVAVIVANSEYRDFFPAVKDMIAAVELLDAYQDVFPTLKDMHAYVQKHGPPVARP